MRQLQTISNYNVQLSLNLTKKWGSGSTLITTIPLLNLTLLLHVVWGIAGAAAYIIHIIPVLFIRMTQLINIMIKLSIMIINLLIIGLKIPLWGMGLL